MAVNNLMSTSPMPSRGGKGNTRLDKKNWRNQRVYLEYKTQTGGMEKIFEGKSFNNQIIKTITVRFSNCKN